MTCNQQRCVDADGTCIHKPSADMVADVNTFFDVFADGDAPREKNFFTTACLLTSNKYTTKF